MEITKYYIALIITSCWWKLPAHNYKYETFSLTNVLPGSFVPVIAGKQLISHNKSNWNELILVLLIHVDVIKTHKKIIYVSLQVKVIWESSSNISLEFLNHFIN